MSLPPSADIPQQLTMASTAWSKLRRLATYAAFDGWTLAILGALTLICGGYGSISGLLLSMALLGTGIFELASVGQLRRLNPSAINRLACNQLVLAGALILYAIVCLMQSRGGGEVISPEIEQSLAQLGLSTSELNDQLSTVQNTGLIAVALLVQGGTALYYFSRQKHLLRYLQQTPPWIQQMQRDRGEISL